MSGPEARYQATLAEGRFEIQRCGHCGAAQFYPRVVCTRCGSTELGWFAPSGRGTVYSTTVVRRKAADGGDYNVALVDLAEGPRMMSQVVDVAPAAVRIGMPVTARVEAGEVPRVVFSPMGGDA